MSLCDHPAHSTTEGLLSPAAKTAFAVRRGTAHQLKLTPCQDAAAGSSRLPCAVIVLCDGAGSQPLSGRAAECLAQWAAAWLPTAFEQLYPLPEAEIATQILQNGWEQLAQLGLSRQECWSTFLCFARHEDGRWLAFHIGDGFIFHADGVISMPENGIDPSETYFFTGTDARRHLRVQKGRHACRTAVLLTSDGCGDALYDWERGTPAPAVKKLLAGFEACTEQEAQQALAHNLESVFSRYSEDDLSLALLWAAAPGTCGSLDTDNGWEEIE